MSELQKFRVHLIYKADGMRRPLSFRQAIPAVSVSEAVRLATHFIETAYESGFEVLTWSCENLSKPVEVKYVGKAFAEEVNGETDEEEEPGEPIVKSVTGFNLLMHHKYSQEETPRTDLGR